MNQYIQKIKTKRQYIINKILNIILWSLYIMLCVFTLVEMISLQFFHDQIYFFATLLIVAAVFGLGMIIFYSISTYEKYLANEKIVYTKILEKKKEEMRELKEEIEAIKEKLK